MWRNFLLLRKGGVFSVYTILGFMEIVSFRYIKYLDGIHLHPGPPVAPLAFLFLPAAAKSSCCFPDLFHLLFSFLVIKFLPSKPNARFKHENCIRNQKSLLLKARKKSIALGWGCIAQQQRTYVELEDPQLEAWQHKS